MLFVISVTLLHGRPIGIETPRYASKRSTDPSCARKKRMQSTFFLQSAAGYPLGVSWELIFKSNRHLHVHTAQLLDQQLSSIWHGDFAHCLFALAQLAPAAVAHLAACVQKMLVKRTVRRARRTNLHFSQTSTLWASELIISRSSNSCDAPYAIKQSRSISPRRKPPSLARPSVG